MPPIQDHLRSLANRLGFDISRHRPGRMGKCPFRDLRQFVPAQPGPIILDVGANEGQTVRSFKAAFPDCVIHSFEPATATFARLQESVAREKDVFAWKCALGASVGRQTFLENTNSDMSSFLELSRDGWGSVERQETVEVMTVDGFMTEHDIESVDILKSDTQGYDLQVFKGAEDAMHEGRIGFILTELIFSDMYARLPPFDEIYRHLLDYGFRLVSIYHFEHQNGLAGWADALFANPNYRRLRA